MLNERISVQSFLNDVPLAKHMSYVLVLEKGPKTIESE